MGTPVLLPALLIFFRAEWLFLSIADDPDAAGGDTIGHEGFPEGLGAILPKGDVVLRRTSVVTVSFNHNFHACVLGQERSVLLGYRRVFRTDVELVVIEIDVTNVLRE